MLVEEKRSSQPLLTARPCGGLNGIVWDCRQETSRNINASGGWTAAYTLQNTIIYQKHLHGQEGEMANEQPKRRRLEEQKLKKKRYHQARLKSHVNIERQCWRDLHDLKLRKTDTEFSLFLLDKSLKHQFYHVS